MVVIERVMENIKAEIKMSDLEKVDIRWGRSNWWKTY